MVPALFTFYIQGVLKLKKNNSGAYRLSVNVEQRVNLKFFVKRSNSATETYDLLKKVTDLMNKLLVDIEHCLRQWKNRTERYKNWGGQYIEGNNISLV